MKVNLGSSVLRINISFAAAVTLTLIIDESGLCSAAFFCCIIHEAGHLLCLFLLGDTPKKIELSFYGARIERKGGCMSALGEALIYASGPVANFILFAVVYALSGSRELKTAAVISLCIGLFNLLPSVPLDGGNMLHLLLERFTDGEKSNKICHAVSCIIIAPMFIFGAVLLIKNGNITLLSVSVYLAIMTFINKKNGFFNKDML